MDGQVIHQLVRRLGHELRLMAVALQFFTRVPVTLRTFDPRWLNDCARWFPLVGAAVGLFGAAVLLAVAAVWPLPVAVVASMAATAWMTGGFHEDGLADTCDGLGGAVTRERALEIMKDSRVGSYGVLGLVLTLALKAAALLALGEHGTRLAAAGGVLAHVVSRFMPVAMLRALTYAGDAAQAKARPLAQQVGDAAVAVAAAVTALVAALGPLAGLPALRVAGALAAATLVALGCGRWLRRRLGGFTGDTLGATQQWCEAAVLLALTAGLAG